MTALDQAFIKAFSQQGAKSPVIDALPKKATPTETRQFTATPLEKHAATPQRPASVAAAPSNAFSSVLAALERQPVAPARTAASHRPTFHVADRELKTAEPLDITEPTLTAEPTLTTGRSPITDAGIDLSSQVDAIAAATSQLIDEPNADAEATLSMSAPAPRQFAEPAVAHLSSSAPLAGISASPTAPLSSFLREMTETPSVAMSEKATMPDLGLRAAEQPMKSEAALSEPKPQKMPPIASKAAAQPATDYHADRSGAQTTAAEADQTGESVRSRLETKPVEAFTELPTGGFQHEEFQAKNFHAENFQAGQTIERFTWPKVCRRLIARSPDEFDRLADALLAAATQGQKVLGFTSCRQGEGVTTLVLCAARRLADRGVKLSLVDADVVRPRLGKRLGVQPEASWNETDAESLGQAAIEAVANSLTLATIVEPAESAQWTPEDWTNLGSVLHTMRNHSELTIVDLGPLENIANPGDAIQRATGGQLDALLLVRNQRVTADESLEKVEHELTAAKIPLAGLIENFIAE